jgi:sorbitol-specific phosphotransferase system component IIC
MPKPNLSIALFIFLFSIAGLFIGMLLAQYFIPNGVGLAGGAMVLSYGLAGLFIALITGIISQRFLNKNMLKRGSILFGIFNLLMILWIVYKINK